MQAPQLPDIDGGNSPSIRCIDLQFRQYRIYFKFAQRVRETDKSNNTFST